MHVYFVKKFLLHHSGVFKGHAITLYFKNGSSGNIFYLCVCVCVCVCVFRVCAEWSGVVLQGTGVLSR